MNYLGKNIRHLRKTQANMSQGKLAAELGIGRGALSSYELSLAEPSLQVLTQLSSFFKLTIDHLVNVDLSIQGACDETPLTGDAHMTGENLRVLVVTANQEDDENVELVPKKATAGYTQGYADEKFLEDLPKYKLPFLSRGRSYRAFEIEGDSMLPILPNSIVIGEYIQNFYEVKDGEVCVVVTDDGVVLKRLYNKIKSRNTLLLQSSNMLYEPYEIDASSVKEIWRFVAYISKEIPEVQNSPEENLRQAIESLKLDVMELKSNARM